jgi:hypothetical protein
MLLKTVNLIEQRFSLLEICAVEAFGEPTANLG